MELVPLHRLVILGSCELALDALESPPFSERIADASRDEKHIAFVAEYLKSKKAGSSSMLHFMAKDKLGISRPVIESVPGTDDDGIRTALQKNPELRAWVFYEMLLRDKLVPADSRRFVTDRLKGLRPTVIEPRR